MSQEVSVLEIRQVDLTLLRAFQGKLAAALADKTTVAGTPAFQQITEGLRLCGQRLERLMPDSQAVDVTPAVEAKKPAAGDALVGLKIKSGT